MTIQLRRFRAFRLPITSAASGSPIRTARVIRIRRYWCNSLRYRSASQSATRAIARSATAQLYVSETGEQILGMRNAYCLSSVTQKGHVAMTENSRTMANGGERGVALI